ncbi:hypothetical protein ABZ397_12335 [Streptomyces sp. NPDC005876]|uniref:hypothetical protein n=1 Tax=Streptomyces sp. NPDC005876 TaxID=3157076 RepID=UPI0033E7876B
MYGNSVVPPSRSAATVITLRVLFAVAGFLTCGLLACVPLFRIAVLRGRWYDWTAAWVSLPVSITCLAVVGSLPETDYRSDIALAACLLLGAAATAHFLVVDIRTHAAPRTPFPGYPPPPVPPAGAYYGQAHTVPPGAPAGPYAPTPIPGPPHPTTPHPGIPDPRTATPHMPHPSPTPQTHRTPHTPVPHTPHTPAPQRPAPARIDQVRAELDELSDYLRRQEGQDGTGGHEGRR